jgi:hypothetical protein
MNIGMQASPQAILEVQLQLAQDHREWRWLHQCLIYHAIAFGEAKQGRELFLARIAIKRDPKSDIPESDWRVLRDPEGPAEVEVSFCVDDCVAEFYAKRRCHGVERDPGTCDQCLEQHIAGTGVQSGAASRRMETCGDKSPSSFDFAGHVFAQSALSPKGDERRFWLLPVMVL